MSEQQSLHTYLKPNPVIKKKPPQYKITKYQILISLALKLQSNDSDIIIIKTQDQISIRRDRTVWEVYIWMKSCPWDFTKKDMR